MIDRCLENVKLVVATGVLSKVPFLGELNTRDKINGLNAQVVSQM